jgi:hypothetical protein
MVTKKLGATIIIRKETKNEKIKIKVKNKKNHGTYNKCECLNSIRISKKWVHHG